MVVGPCMASRARSPPRLIAVSISSTLKPSSTRAAAQNIAALMTNKNRPSVTSVSSKLTIQMRKYSLPEAVKRMGSSLPGSDSPKRVAGPESDGGPKDELAGSRGCGARASPPNVTFMGSLSLVSPGQSSIGPGRALPTNGGENPVGSPSVGADVTLCLPAGPCHGDRAMRHRRIAPGVPDHVTAAVAVAARARWTCF